MKDGKIRTESVNETIDTLKVQIQRYDLLGDRMILARAMQLVAIQEYAAVSACSCCSYFKGGCSDNPCPAECSIIYEDAIEHQKRKMKR